MLKAFDAPTREECTADRPISSTPTAALVLLNDPSFVEAARALAAKILANDMNDDQQRIHWAWRQVLGRAADSGEVQPLAELLEKHRATLDHCLSGGKVRSHFPFLIFHSISHLDATPAACYPLSSVSACFCLPAAGLGRQPLSQMTK